MVYSKNDRVEQLSAPPGQMGSMRYPRNEFNNASEAILTIGLVP
jgi:hypothetical protein